MLTQWYHTLLLLLPFMGCAMDRQQVMVKLPNGGTSASFRQLVHDQASGHHYDTTKESNQEKEEDSGIIKSTGQMVNVTQHTSSTSTSTRTSITTTSTSTTNIMSSVKMTTTKYPSTTQDQFDNNQTTASSQLPPHHPCHLSCLEALNSTSLTPTNSFALKSGSSLTLQCHMPLVPQLILEEILWLFHPQGSPEGQCSLTPQRYLPSCPGFSSLSETDNRNETFVMQTLTLLDLGTNHTGDYICQVQVTCCPAHQQHLMNTQLEVKVKVTVWWMDYTLQLAGTGVLAVVLLVSLLGASVYSWRKEAKNHYLAVVEMETPAVLHLPLINDQDTDSFDSSLNEQEIYTMPA